jgi:hypothetical protein
MEHYHQMRSACGLASALMLLKPGADTSSKILLDATSELLERQYPGLKSIFDRVGTRYQLAEAFLLLESARSEAIQDALAEHDAAVYQDIVAVILYEMRVRLCGRRAGGGPMAEMLDAYSETGKIPARLLEAYATVVKSNVEVKLLMALFGYEQVAFSGSEDGTGALPVSALSRKRGLKERLSTDARSAGEAFLIDNFDKCGILVLKDAHWSAIKAMIIEDGHAWSLHFIDPGIARGREFRLDPWDPRARLYFFRKEPALLTVMAGLVKGLLEDRETAADGGPKPTLEDPERNKDKERV